MSKLGQKKIFISRFISFEVKNFVNMNLIWIQGPYKILKLKMPSAIILQWPSMAISKDVYSNLKSNVCKNNLKLKVTSLALLTNFYQCEKFSVIKQTTARYSLSHIAINNALIGSLSGFKRYLRVRGVGYKFSLNSSNKNIIIIDVGYSHVLVKGLQTEFRTKFSRKFTKIRVKTSQLSKLTQFFSHIRKQRKPDVYKGKGIRYKHDTVRKKEGKKKKTF